MGTSESKGVKKEGEGGGGGAGGGIGESDSLAAGNSPPGGIAIIAIVDDYEIIENKAKEEGAVKLKEDLVQVNHSSNNNNNNVSSFSQLSNRVLDKLIIKVGGKNAGAGGGGSLDEKEKEEQQSAVELQVISPKNKEQIDQKSDRIERNEQEQEEKEEKEVKEVKEDKEERKGLEKIISNAEIEEKLEGINSSSSSPAQLSIGKNNNKSDTLPLAQINNQMNNNSNNNINSDPIAPNSVVGSHIAAIEGKKKLPIAIRRRRNFSFLQFCICSSERIEEEEKVKEKEKNPPSPLFDEDKTEGKEEEKNSLPPLLHTSEHSLHQSKLEVQSPEFLSSPLVLQHSSRSVSSSLTSSSLTVPPPLPPVGLPPSHPIYSFLPLLSSSNSPYPNCLHRPFDLNSSQVTLFSMQRTLNFPPFTTQFTFEVVAPSSFASSLHPLQVLHDLEDSSYQYYLSTISQCLNLHQQYLDPTFPPNSSSLFGHFEPKFEEITAEDVSLYEEESWSLFSAFILSTNYDTTSSNRNTSPPLVWRRPTEMSKPTLLTSFTSYRILPLSWSSNLPIRQGNLGNCYFVSALISLAEKYPFHLQSLLLTKEINSSGVYQLRICKNGEWTVLLIDDLFPVSTIPNSPFSYFFRFTHSLDCSLWASLIEKAFSKAYGSYKSLEKGSSDEVLADLTGAPAFQLFFHSQEIGRMKNMSSVVPLVYTSNENDELVERNIWLQLMLFKSRKYALVANCSYDHHIKAEEEKLHESKEGLIDEAGSGEDYHSKWKKKYASVGLIPSHAYAILDVIMKDKLKLVKLKNPWGRFSWKGKWSNGKERIETNNNRKLDNLNINSNRNEKSTNQSTNQPDSNKSKLSWNPFKIGGRLHSSSSPSASPSSSSPFDVDPSKGIFLMLFEDFLFYFSSVSVSLHQENWFELRVKDKYSFWPQQHNQIPKSANQNPKQTPPIHSSQRNQNVKEEETGKAELKQGFLSRLANIGTHSTRNAKQNDQAKRAPASHVIQSDSDGATTTGAVLLSSATFSSSSPVHTTFAQLNGSLTSEFMYEIAINESTNIHFTIYQKDRRGEERTFAPMPLYQPLAIQLICSVIPRQFSLQSTPATATATVTVSGEEKNNGRTRFVFKGEEWKLLAYKLPCATRSVTLSTYLPHIDHSYLLLIDSLSFGVEALPITLSLYTDRPVYLRPIPLIRSALIYSRLLIPPSGIDVTVSAAGGPSLKIQEIMPLIFLHTYSSSLCQYYIFINKHPTLYLHLKIDSTDVTGVTVLSSRPTNLTYDILPPMHQMIGLVLSASTHSNSNERGTVGSHSSRAGLSTLFSIRYSFRLSADPFLTGLEVKDRRHHPPLSSIDFHTPRPIITLERRN